MRRVGVALGDDRLALVLRDDRKLAAVIHVHRDAAGTQVPGEAEGQRVGEVFEAGLARTGGDSSEDRHEAGRARGEPPLVERRRADRRDDDHRPTRAGHADAQEPLAVIAGQVSEVAEDTAVLGEAEPEREDDAIAALGDRLFEAEHGERLGGVAADEVGDVGPPGERGRDGSADALGVPRRGGDDHERLGRTVDGVLDDESHDAGDLGVRALDGAGHRVGRTVPALDVIDAEAAATEIRACPRQRDQTPVVEGRVHELGEILSSRAVAAREDLFGHDLGEPFEDAHVVERDVVIGLVGELRCPGSDPERRRLLRHRVTEGDDLRGAAEGRRRLGETERRGISDHDDVERRRHGDRRHLVW